jgi:DNA-binding FadR family transcriptional regulator
MTVSADTTVPDLDGLFGAADELKSDRIAARLERQILSGRLAPGTRLPTENEFCEILGVSRTVVRDAIRSLTAKGLVTVRRARGTTVAEPSDDAFGQALLSLLARSDLTIGDVIEARATIERRLVAVAAANGTEHDWEQLDSAYSEFAAAVAAGDFTLAQDRHLDFHLGVLKAIHQPALELFLKPMTEIIIVSSVPNVRAAKVDWDVDTHYPIIEALRRRDAAAAEQAMEAHFAAGLDRRRYRAFRATRFREAFAERA